MSEVLARLLAEPLDKEVRRNFERCWRSMWRDLDYLAATNELLLGRAADNGWTIERIRVVSVLNSFSRIVMGPLFAAYGTVTKVGLGRETPVQFGEHVEVSSRKAATIEPALTAFAQLTIANGMKQRWLNITRTADLVWAMTNQNDQGLGEGNGESPDD